jgi:tRNA dimethylallyltransferase
MGPTASGKTALAVQLAQRFDCGIISVDSAMIYRGMDVGTAKPDPEILKAAPHRLIDILDPAESYSAARFREDALSAMVDIAASGRTPLLVGGTMLYFNALQYGLSTLPSADAVIRAEIDVRAAKEGWPALHVELAGLDPDAASRIHPNDPQRIQRALEVYRLTGQPLSTLQRGTGTPAPYNFIKLALMPADRATLHVIIESRFRAMLKAGFLEEVRGLRARGDLNPNMPSMRAVGYRQLWEYLDGICTLDDAIRRGIVATRRYAKRQFTWLRGEDDVTYFDSATPQLVDEVCIFMQRARARESYVPL